MCIRDRIKHLSDLGKSKGNGRIRQKCLPHDLSVIRRYTGWYIHRQPVSISDFPYEDAGISADYLWRPYYMEVPVYHGLPHPLWGLTARITMDVVAHL